MKPVIREIDKKYIEVIGHYDNPILCAKLTLIADMFAIEHKNGYAKFDVKDYDKLSFIDDRLEFSVTDLTNTKWVFNNSISLSFGQYNINYESDGSTFDILNVTSSYLSYDLAGDTSQQAYFNSAWTNQAYRIIEITGGNDVTNSTLIQWLEANATQVTIDDLTGTTWLFNDTVNIEGYGGSWDIIFNHGDGMYVGIGIPGYVIDYNTNGNDYTAYYDNAWVDETYKTIEITGGTDVTNVEFIAWLEGNATQSIEPVVTDLTNTKWLIKKPSEWVNPFSSATSFNLNINNKITCGSYESANTNNIRGVFKYFGTILAMYINNSDDTNYPNINITFVDYPDGEGEDSFDVSHSSTSGGEYTSLGDLETILEITTGDDVTNQNLITFLETNATQILPTFTSSFNDMSVTNDNGFINLRFKDVNYKLEKASITTLANTRWILNKDILYAPSSQISFTINGKIDDVDFTVGAVSGDSSTSSAVLILAHNESGYVGIYMYHNNSIQYKHNATPNSIITFTDGTDIANVDLINWLSKNATMIVEDNNVSDSSFNQIKINGNVLSINDFNYALSIIGESSVSDSNNSSFKSFNLTDNGDGTITLTLGDNSITVKEYVFGLQSSDNYTLIDANDNILLAKEESLWDYNLVGRTLYIENSRYEVNGSEVILK